MTDTLERQPLATIALPIYAHPAVIQSDLATAVVPLEVGAPLRDGIPNEAAVTAILRDLIPVASRSSRDDALTALGALGRPEPAPTAPGFFLDRDGDLWRRREGGKFRYVGDITQGVVVKGGAPLDPAHHGPYRRILAEWVDA